MANLKNIISTDNRTFIIRPLDTRGRLPIIIKKDKVFKSDSKEKLKTLLLSDTYRKEDVLYESRAGDFLQGTSQHKITLINKLNVTTNSSCTYANYRNDSGILISQKSSKNVIKLIGQKNYDTVLSALCSVINQELKIRAILALLSENDKKFVDSSCQTDKDDDKDINEEITKDSRSQRRKRVKRTTLTPYVIKDSSTPTPKIKKLVIDPFKTSDRRIIEDLDNGIKFEISDKMKNEQHILPDIKHIVNDEYSNDGSIGSIGNLSSLSVSMDNLLDNPNDLLKKVDQYTAESNNKGSTFKQPLMDIETSNFNNINHAYIPMLDGTRINVPVKPEDHFHIATPDILRSVTKEERSRLISYQAYIDYKFCLERDEVGNLPIHNAVMNNDVYMLRRQCLVLKNRHASIDITANNMTPLQMSLFASTAQCTTLLLNYGADPLHTDDEQRTVLHLAAETVAPHLGAIVAYCQNNAMQILQEHEDLWCPSLEGKNRSEVAKYLLDHMCNMVDSQGYTPLMTASKTGAALNVNLLVAVAPASINTPMPNSGNTALFLAVGAACLDAMERCNKSKLAENFAQTIKTLIKSGADPNICNHSGQNVHDLMTEFSIPELTALLATVIASNNGVPNYDTRMLVKEEDGTVYVEEIASVKTKIIPGVNKNKNDKKSVKKEKINADKKDKPVILEDISLTPSITNAVPKTTICKNIEIVTEIKLDSMTGPKVTKGVPFKLLREESSDANNIITTQQNSFYMNKIANFVECKMTKALKKSIKPKYWTIKPCFLGPDITSAGSSSVINNTSKKQISSTDVKTQASDDKKADEKTESLDDKIASTVAEVTFVDVATISNTDKLDDDSIDVTDVNITSKVETLKFVSDSSTKSVPGKRKSTTSKPRAKKSKNIKDP